ncbi:hypothetical protein HOLleu_34178 [Holothuria leucospilota]|uniref:Uncharacterized protein n=1 Tax=Holothuria leucospilota TaxID=206669 RepID=A0A9Q1BIB0_HOLLE|nr:hypothetical protein HOLleu_34178 [Holothuria leucospilota]
MVSQNSSRFVCFVQWMELHWSWFVATAGLIILFVLSMPSFYSDVLLVRIQEETNSSLISPEWVWPIQTTVIYLLCPLSGVMMACFQPAYVVIFGSAIASASMVASSLVSSEVIFVVTMGLLYPLSLTFCLNTIAYNLSTHFPKDSFTKPFAISSMGIPLGALLMQSIKDQIVYWGKWRTQLQIIAGVYPALLIPFAAFIIPKKTILRKRFLQNSNRQSLSSRKSWTTSIVLGEGRTEDDCKIDPEQVSPNTSLDRNKTPVGINSLYSKKRGLSLLDCNNFLLFVWLLLPPIAWFVQWFGLTTFWNDMHIGQRTIPRIHMVMAASDILGRVLAMVVGNRLASQKIGTFVIQIMLYTAISFVQILILHQWSALICAIICSMVRGLFEVLAFSIVIQEFSSLQCRKSVTFTMLSLGVGHLSGLLFTGAVHFTTNSFRHLFFVNILAYQTLLFVIVATPLTSRKRKPDHDKVEWRVSASTDATSDDCRSERL